MHSYAKQFATDLYLFHLWMHIKFQFAVDFDSKIHAIQIVIWETNEKSIFMVQKANDNAISLKSQCNNIINIAHW